MSEKRFVLYEHKDDYYILQNPRLHLDFIEMLGDALTDEEIVEKLNQLDDKVVELAEENEQLRQQHQRLYNYFKDYLEDEMSTNNFSEMWDNVKEDENWEDE